MLLVRRFRFKKLVEISLLGFKIEKSWQCLSIFVSSTAKALQCRVIELLKFKLIWPAKICFVYLKVFSVFLLFRMNTNFEICPIQYTSMTKQESLQLGFTHWKKCFHCVVVHYISRPLKSIVWQLRRSDLN